MGCGGKTAKAQSQTLECSTSELGMDMNIVLEIDNKKMTSMNMDMKMPYEVFGATKEDIKAEDEAEAKEMFKQQFSQFGEADVEFLDDAMKISVKLNETGLSQTELFDGAELNKDIDINEIKTSAEANGGTCTIK